MARTNKLTSGVFVNLVRTSREISAYDEFINNKFRFTSEECVKYLEKYESLIDKRKEDLKLLADLEEIIMQLRTRDNIEDIKLSVVREYIYARCPFYRRDKDSKDIRVIVGLTEFYGEDMKKLLGNKEFMAKAKEKLVSAIDDEIDIRRKSLGNRINFSRTVNVTKEEMNDLVKELLIKPSEEKIS